MENRFGPAAAFARFIGFENPAFFSSPWVARASIMVMDSWVWIPFIIIMLLAGLQALPNDVKEAAKVDGANRWQSFWEITFPLMLPVSMTAILLRVIFELKLADIVINVTAGGPGGATDTISSFIYREYRDRSNVGYGTMIAEVYLIIIIIFVLLLLKATGRFMQKMTLRDASGGRGSPRSSGSQHVSAVAAARPKESDVAGVDARVIEKTLIYGALAIWTFIALFPLYWTVSTSFKLGRDVTQGHLIPWIDFSPSWKGLQSLGLSPDTIFTYSNVREEFLDKFINSAICTLGASALAVVLGSLAAYGLSRFNYKFAVWRNKDISFFFLSQLILPPVVLAMPFLILYKELALLDTRIGLILVYTLMVLPIVIWVMRDQFDTIPNEIEQAAMVDGCSIWGAFFRIVLPIALPGMVASFILSTVLCWNEYFFASLLTGFDAQTLPVMVASQTGSQGINWWTMATLSTAAIFPLVLVGIFLERYIVMGLTAGSVK
jgi:multiple sugar transport system permease protein